VGSLGTKRKAILADNVQAIVRGCLDWTKLVQDMIQWRAFANVNETSFKQRSGLPQRLSEDQLPSPVTVQRLADECTVTAPAEWKQQNGCRHNTCFTYLNRSASFTLGVAVCPLLCMWSWNLHTSQERNAIPIWSNAEGRSSVVTVSRFRVELGYSELQISLRVYCSSD